MCDEGNVVSFADRSRAEQIAINRAAAAVLSIGAKYEFNPAVTATGLCRESGVGFVQELKFERGTFHGLNEGRFSNFPAGSMLFEGKPVGWNESFLYGVDNHPGSVIKPV
jgi:hypothetical protein